MLPLLIKLSDPDPSYATAELCGVRNGVVFVLTGVGIIRVKIGVSVSLRPAAPLGGTVDCLGMSHPPGGVGSSSTVAAKGLRAPNGLLPVIVFDDVT